MFKILLILQTREAKRKGGGNTSSLQSSKLISDTRLPPKLKESQVMI